MPTISPVQSADVQAAISRAATRTGVDFDYLLAQAKLESDLDPSAKARTSSATGLYQFIESTWLRTLDRHGAKHGMNWAEAAITANGRVADAATRDRLLSLRNDADTASLMAAELALDNAEGLRTKLGRDPEPVELYLAHFLGLGGAKKFLGALNANPDQSAVALMPRAAQANRPIFYAGGSPRSVGDVMELMRGKVEAAYGVTPIPVSDQRPPVTIASASGSGNVSTNTDTNVSATTAEPPQFQPPAPWRRSGARSAAALPITEGPRPSMADTLRLTFGDGSAHQSRANQHIANAYGKFKAFGL